MDEPMHGFVWPAAVTIGAGVSVLVQQVLNANLRAELNSAAWSCSPSPCAIPCLPPTPWLAPLWAWSGGIFGAIFIALSIVTIPKLGGAAYIAILVTGQLIAALAFDHFGWLGISKRPIDLPRLLGVAFLISGVVVMRR